MTTAYNLIALLAVAIGSFNFGYTFGLATGLIGLPGPLAYFDISLTGDNPSYASSMQGAVVGIFFAGGFFGSFFFAWLADKVGRRTAIFVVNMVGIVAAILSAASVHIGMFLVARLLQGFAGGGLNVICPMFQSEISVAAHRGRNVGLHGVFFLCGLASANWTCYGAFFATNQSLQWRLPCALQAVAPLLLSSMQGWLPESPRWLIQHGRSEQAFTTLCKLHDTPGEADHALAKEEQLMITKQIELDSRHDISWGGLLRRPSTRRRLMLGFFTMFMQQSTGQNVLYGFQVNVLASLGVGASEGLLIVGCYVTWAAVLNWVGAWVMDRLGRRTMMLGALCGTTVSTIIHTSLVLTYGGTTSKVGNGAAVAFLFLFITFFAPGIDVTSYVYSAEIFPTYMRARGLSVTIATYFGMSALYTSTSSVATGTIGAYYNIVFIVVSAINIVIGYFVMVETKGLSLEEMGLLFGEQNEVAHIEAGDHEKIGQSASASDEKMGSTDVSVVPV
ncbi:hypothetical protein IAT38_005040 [Cryptococcus sp. DSM 104549]